MTLHEDEHEEEVLKRNKDLAAELRKLALMAEAGKVPVLCAIYQIKRQQGDNGHGAIAHVHGGVAMLYSVIGQLQHLTFLASQNVPDAPDSTFGPEEVPA